MPEEAQVAQSLNPGAQRIVEGAHQRQQEAKHPQLGALLDSDTAITGGHA